MAICGTIRRGMSGTCVLKLQEALVRYGFPVAIDGVFGSNTEEAVISFQGMMGLTKDGIVGAKTWSALEPTVTPKYDPVASVLASKKSNAPSEKTVAKQAAINAPQSSGWFSDILGVAKDVLQNIPITLKTGQYKITRATPGQQLMQTGLQTYYQPAPTTIMDYMPYILIGGAGLMLLFLLKK